MLFLGMCQRDVVVGRQTRCQSPEQVELWRAAGVSGDDCQVEQCHLLLHLMQVEHLVGLSFLVGIPRFDDTVGVWHQDWLLSTLVTQLMLVPLLPPPRKLPPLTTPGSNAHAMLWLRRNRFTFPVCTVPSTALLRVY